ncbi:MAG TPA: amidohydrolase family protein [Rhodanobacteraceae bacterium]|nr:amidohydrolase family protein [Rhodanobacteraceae bacterium]
MDACLRHAALVMPGGVRRVPLPVHAGRIVRSATTRAWRCELRDHLVFPGLVNAHEHLQVNAVPPLQAGAPFADSYAWIDAFKAHFAEPAVIASLQIPKTLRLRHGALKNILAGTTCVAHHDPWHPALDALAFPVALLRGHGWSYALGGPDFGPPACQSFAVTPPDRPWLIHLAEGTSATAQAELEQLDRLGCLAGNSVLIHGVGLRPQDVDRVLARQASVVWCPASNHALLGRTLDPQRLCAAGLLALGTDSRLSGARDLLDEMRGVLARGELAAGRLLPLVTDQAARILRMPLRGTLAAGAPADMVIVRDRGGDPASSLVGVSRSELRAVVRDGRPCIADPDFAGWFEAAGVPAVPVILDGVPKLLAESLAEPRLLALEPGLERTADVPTARAGDALEAAC